MTKQSLSHVINLSGNEIAHFAVGLHDKVSLRIALQLLENDACHPFGFAARIDGREALNCFSATFFQSHKLIFLCYI